MTTYDELERCVTEITGAQMPCVPSASLEFYLEIERIRCEGAARLCADFLQRVHQATGDEVAARAKLEPIRQRLARLYPEQPGLHDKLVWPFLRAH